MAAGATIGVWEMTGAGATTRAVCASVFGLLSTPPTPLIRASANPTTSCNVCNAPNSSGLNAGKFGTRSCSADRISTRLIESIPRS